MRASELALILNARLLAEKDVTIHEVNNLIDAEGDQLSMVLWPIDIKLAKNSSAGVVIISLEHAADHAHELPPALVVVEDLYQAWQQVCSLLGNQASYQRNIANSTTIKSGAQVGDAFVGEHTVIDHNAVIKSGAVIKEHCYIGPGVVIDSGVTVEANVTIGANSVIGSCAFVPYGEQPLKKLPSLGKVSIGKATSIGAGCTIDRGLLGLTKVGQGCMLDNMCHIGHDVIIDDNVIIAGQSALAGFVRLGDRVTCGGQIGVAPHVKIGNDARISGKSGVHTHVGSNEVWSGNPALPHDIYLRYYSFIKLKYGKKKYGYRANQKNSSSSLSVSFDR